MDRSSLREYWAKSPVGTARAGESLPVHTAAVIARLSEFSKIYPTLPDVCGVPRIWHYAFWACLLHDFGKLALGFQAQLRQETVRWNKRHEVLSLAFVDWVVPSLFSEDAAWISAGIVTHHKDLDEIQERYPVDADDLDEDDGLLQELVSEISPDVLPSLAVWLADDAPRLAKEVNLAGVDVRLSLPRDPSSDILTQGARRIARNLLAVRSLRRQLSHLPSGHQSNKAAIALRGLVMLADHSASARVSPASLRPCFCNKDVWLRLGFESSDKLYPHQKAAANATGSAILSAPTGSGKTEAALLWAARQCDLTSIGRLLYVLPYQASLNAMHNRLSGSFPRAVALQHGRALQALYRNLLEKGYTSSAAAAAARNAKQLARLHHHPIRVLTPYQLLRGMFRLKGYESLLTDCTRACLVFDEIHAYEPFRLGMILAAMEYLREQWDCRLFVMSATLPSRLRMELQDVLGYPHRIVADVQTYCEFARHRLNLLSGTIDCEATLKRILDSSRIGKAVLLVCNTVRKARDVYVRLKQSMPDANGVVHLLHSRFTARDRLTKEKAISAIVGTRSRSESANGNILVATQVVEVSLDIDFDVVFSEPAPLESLIQRFGRVNRGRRHSLCDVFVLAEPLSGQRVYEDSYVAAGYSALRPLVDKPIDEATITQMLDEVYSGSEADRWFEALNKGRQEFKAACLTDLRAFQSDQTLEDQFDRMFDGTEVLSASHVDEYRALLEKDPIGATELLIPMPYWQLQQLRKVGRVRADRTLPWVKIAHVPYDSDGGLHLETVANE